MSYKNTLVADNIGYINDAIVLLEQLNDDLYRKSLSPGLSSVGKHLRHVLDHYGCLFMGIEDGHVDYDARERNESIETDRQVARRRAHEIVVGLEQLAVFANPEVSSLFVRSNGRNVHDWSRSTLERELQYLLSHTIHHYAFMAMVLRLQGFEISEDFGIAPATLEYQAR